MGYWLRKLSNHVSDTFAKRLEPYDVSVPQWVVLRILYDHEKLALKEVCTRVGVDQGALSRMMDRLLARKLITREEGKTDRRKIALALTREGKLLVPKLAKEADENDRAFFGRLSSRQRKDWEAMVELLLSLNRSELKTITLE